MELDPAALVVVRALVRAVLDHEEGAPPPPPFGELVGADVAWGPVVRAAARHRVALLLLAHADDLALPDDVRAALVATRDAQRQRLMLQTLETVRAVATLDAAGVQVLAFKGQALAVQTTGDHTARGSGDVDLLIAPTQADAAHAALVAAGWAPPEAIVIRPGLWGWRHVVHHGSALSYTGAGADADLHWRLEPDLSPHPDFATLWARRAEVVIGGRTVPTLAPADALRHLASHREGGAWLRTLVDLRRLSRLTGVFDAPLHRTALPSLAMARVTVGLPPTVPDDVLRRLDAVAPSVLARMERHHREPDKPSLAHGPGSLDTLRQALASTSGPADVVATGWWLALPPHIVLVLDDRTAWTGVPRTLWRRLSRVAPALGSLLAGLRRRLRART